MISVQDYKRGEVYSIIEKKALYDGDPSLETRVDTICSTHGVFTKTVREDDTIIAVVGGSFLWPGVMELWSVTSTRISAVPLTYIKIVLKLIDQYQKTHDVRRFQAVVLADNFKLQKWMNALGFEKEGLLRAYGPEGKDYLMYARIN